MLFIKHFVGDRLTELHFKTLHESTYFYFSTIISCISNLLDNAILCKEMIFYNEIIAGSNGFRFYKKTKC